MRKLDEILIFLFLLIITITTLISGCKEKTGIKPYSYIENQQALLQYNKAMYFMERKEYSKAIVEFRRFLDYYDKIYYADEAWYNLGRCLFELGQFTEAGNAYKILIKKYKKSKLEKLALVEYAKCYKEKGDFKSAAILFLKVLKKYPISEIVELVDLQMQDILNKFPESKYYLKIKEKYTKLLKKIK